MIRYLSSAVLIVVAGCAPHHFNTRQSGGVTMYLDAPNASQVIFVSSADSFREHPTEKKARGFWMLEGLPDRPFRYFYIVDGKVYTPDCRYREKDDFGAVNCIYQP